MHIKALLKPAYPRPAVMLPPCESPLPDSTPPRQISTYRRSTLQNAPPHRAATVGHPIYACARQGFIMPPVLHISLNRLVLRAFQNMLFHRLPVIIHQAQAVLKLIPKARRAAMLIIPAPRDKTGIVHLISQPVAKQRVPFLYSGAKPYSLRKSSICSHDRPAQPHRFPAPQSPPAPDAPLLQSTGEKHSSVCAFFQAPLPLRHKRQSPPDAESLSSGAHKPPLPKARESQPAASPPVRYSALPPRLHTAALPPFHICSIFLSYR